MGRSAPGTWLSHRVMVFAGSDACGVSWALRDRDATKAELTSYYRPTIDFVTLAASRPPRA